jgi:hypothetical protein
LDGTCDWLHLAFARRFCATWSAQSNVDKLIGKQNLRRSSQNGKTPTTKLNADWVFVGASNELALHNNKRTIVRFAQVMKACVTLYKARDGNLTTKKGDPTAFLAEGELNMTSP